MDENTRKDVDSIVDMDVLHQAGYYIITGVVGMLVSNLIKHAYLKMYNGSHDDNQTEDE